MQIEIDMFHPFWKSYFSDFKIVFVDFKFKSIWKMCGVIFQSYWIELRVPKVVGSGSPKLMERSP